MNDFVTINNDDIKNDRVVINTANLISYIKRSINVDILESKNVSNIKRYIEHNTIEFTFNYNDTMYIATYFIKDNDYEINKVV